MKTANLKKTGRRIAALLLAGAMALSCAACSNSNSTDSSSSSKSELLESSQDVEDRQGMGRYVETTLSRPDGAMALNLAKVGDELRMVSANGVFRSSNWGISWSPMDLGSHALTVAGMDYAVTSGCWDRDGNLLVAFVGRVGPGLPGVNKFYRIDMDGNEQELPITLPGDTASDTLTSPAEDAASTAEPEADGEPDGEEVVTEGTYTTETDVPDDATFVFPNNLPHHMTLAPDNNLLLDDSQGTLYHINPDTGEILHQLGREDLWFNGFTVIGETLVLISFDGALLYDLNTWESKEADPVLNQFLTGRTPEGGDVAPVSEDGSANTIGNGGALVFGSDEEDILYICGRTGLFRHLMGGTVVEQIINGDLCSLSDPSAQIQCMVKTDTTSFRAATYSNVLGYDYNPDMATTPETQLKAYIFYDNDFLRQAIAQYQKSHQDVYITLEVAQGYGSAMMASDALRVLNTEIMAGKGPDILFLDDMPIENYIEKGLLMDLSGMVAEVCEEDELLENIMRAYEQDGKVCAVPSRFSMPLFTAPQDVLDSVTDLDSLATAVEELREAHPFSEQRSITSMTFPYTICNFLYPMCSPAWFKEDGTLDREKITEFLEAAKRIYDAENAGNPDPYAYDYSFYAISDFPGLMGCDIALGTSLVSLEAVNAPKSFSCLLTVLSDVDGYGYKPLKGQAEHTFTPINVVGINAKSEKAEAAQDFLKTLFGQESQNFWEAQGMPVSIPVIKTRITSSNIGGMGISTTTDDGTELSFDKQLFRSATVDQADELLDMFRALDTPTYVNAIILNTITNECDSYIRGDKDLETAVDDLMRQVNLYLSES